jgi:PEP-CTERM motif
MNKFKKRLGLVAVSTLLALGSAAHAATDTFDGNMFSVDYGVSNGGSQPFFSTFHVDATGSASAVEVGNASSWTVDTMGNTLSLTWNKAAEFMNSGSPAFIGLKISDTGGHLADILGASVTNTTYTPSTYGNLVEGFLPSQVTFDANNIYVNVNTAMWHAAPMASMGDPYRDQIDLSVNFQAAPIPEPETYAMLLAGLGLMGGIVRRRQGHRGK